ncbi:MAG: TfoX/Sxy family protein [Candidatus Bathyarchaeota archaeon]
MLVYDLNLEKRIDKLVAYWRSIDSKKIFGGVCFLVNGNMYSGIYKDFLFLRLGKEASENVLKLPYVKPFDITGRPMKGWVMLDKTAIDTDEKLNIWLNKAKDFTLSLPPKK